MARLPQEQEEFLNEGRFGRSLRNDFRDAVPRSNLLRIGLLLIVAAAIVFLAVAATGGGLEDSTPALLFYSSIAMAFAGLLCCAAALLVKVIHKYGGREK